MSNLIIDTAFIVAAGKGTRMAPLTDTIPKPLAQIAGKPLLDYIFDHLAKTAVKRVVVNTHHHAQILRQYLSNKKDFEIIESNEPELLETGGGLKKALNLLGNNPIFMINGDAFWIEDKSIAVLTQLERKFNKDKMDILLSLIPVSKMKLTEGIGDYDIVDDNKIVRNLKRQGTHMFTGIRVLNPEIMINVSEGKYSFLQQMDAAQIAGRLYGVECTCEWHHISTMKDLNNIDNYYNKLCV